MSERPAPGPRRPWHRGLLGDQLTEVPVVTPDETTYLVRLKRNSRLLAPAPSDPVSMAADFVQKNAKTRGETGWTITVVKPASKIRAERTLFTQHVAAQAIVVDVTMAIYNALERGEKLWKAD